MKFVWMIYVGEHDNQILERMMKMLEEEGIQPSHFQESVIFMSLHNDVIWWETAQLKRML